MCKLTTRSAAVLLVLLLMPVAVYAQAAITGVVKDTSAAILPGVTVEASSPALIEKVRSVVSDGTGQYRIVGLPPGTYSVTFSLPGFSTVKREGIELTGTFVATVNGDLKVGALEETITVTGETPVVDVQSAKAFQTLNKDIIAAIPTSRLSGGILALVPGVVGAGGADNVGGVKGMQLNATGHIHGGRDNDGRTYSDGLSTAFNGGASGMYMTNVAGAQETVISTSGGLGEAETSGVVVNVIPRDGGNSFTGSVFAAGANSAMQWSNYTQALKDRGLTAPAEILKNYDLNPMAGGHIIRNRLWFYNTFRFIGADNTVPGMYYNKNAGNVTAWTYDPDASRQASYDAFWGGATARLTSQVTPRNKVTLFWDEQWRCDKCRAGGTATGSPEATGKQNNRPSHMQQVLWSSPVTSRLLLEGGYGQYLMWYRSSQERTDGTFNPLIINAVEQAGIIPGLSFRQPASYSRSQTGTRTWRASMSYVTGAHNMKVGYFGGYQNPLSSNYSYGDISSYRFNAGVANQFTMQGNQPSTYHHSTTNNLIPTSIYGQDQWTRGKLTLQGGVRYDHYITSYPDQSAGGTPLVPTKIFYAAGSVKGVDFNDITSRMGAAYDLFGNGKTALKVSLGKYPLALTGGDLNLNPISRLALSTTRSWTDSNKNFVPDCDLLNPAKNLECGAMGSQSFGKNVFLTNYDPAVISGWGTRQYNWEFGTSVQHQLVANLSVDVGYYRRWYGNFIVTDNRAVGPSDYTPFTLTVTDPRLPGGASTITAYDVNAAKFGQVDNYVTADSGTQVEHWNGLDVNINARLPNGITVRGGMSTGRTVIDKCDLVAKLGPEALFGLSNLGTASTNWASTSYCHQQSPFLTAVNGYGVYTIPRVNVQVSGTFQSTPGLQLAANYNAPNALVAPLLSRSLSGGASSVPVNLVAPGTLYGDRKYQLDFRVAKILRFGKTRTQLGFDLYNATNSGVPQTYNQTFVPGVAGVGSWLTPTDILPARFGKVSVQFDF